MFGTYQRLNVLAFASNREVIRAASLKIAEHHRTAPDKRPDRKAFYRIMLRHHKDAQAMVRRYRL